MRKSYVIHAARFAWLIAALLLIMATPAQMARTAETTPTPIASSAGFGSKPIITKDNVKSLVALTQFGGTSPEIVSEGYIYTGQVAAWSPDGAWLAYNAKDGLRLMSLQSFGTSRRLVGHRDSVGALSFSPDSTKLVTGSGDNTIRLWDVASGKELWHQQIATGGVTNAAFSPDGSVIATSDHTNVVKLWNPADGTPIATLESNLNPERGQSTRMAFSTDGRLIAVAFESKTTQDGAIVVWEVASRTMFSTLTKLNADRILHSVRDMAFNADTLVIDPDEYASNGNGTGLYLWRPGVEAEAQPLQIVDADDAPVNTAGTPYWLGDGKTLLIRTERTIITYRPGADQHLQTQWKNDSYRIYAVSPDGSKLFAGDYNTGNIALLEASTGRVITSAVTNISTQRDLGISPDGTLVGFNVWTGDNQTYVRVLNLISDESHDYLLPDNGGSEINFSADNHRMLVLSGGNISAAVINLDNGSVVSTILDERQSRGFGVYYGQITPDGQRVLLAGNSVGDAASASWYDATTGALIGKIPGVGNMKLSPDGTVIATFDTERGIGTTLLNAQTGTVIARNAAAVASNASFSADGSKLILDSGAILDTKTAQFLRPAIDGVGGTSSLSPDGSLLAISSPQLRIFDTDSGTDISSVIAEGIKEVVFGAGGRVLVVQREDSVQVLGIDEAGGTVEMPTVPEVAYWDKNCVLTLSSETGENPISLFKSDSTGCGSGDSGGISWSPDGSKLLIGWDVYDVTGRRLLGIGYQGNLIKPKFSADSKQIYFVEDKSGSILLYTFGSDAPQKFSPTQREELYKYPEMSRDGRTMYVANSISITDGLIAIDIASGQVSKQIAKSGGIKSFERFGGMPHVAPNGQQLAVIDFIPSNQHDQIVIMDSDGTNQRLLYSNTSPNPIRIEQMEWSPDGTRLAVIYRDQDFGLITIDVQSGVVKTLIPSFAVTNIEPQPWTADSKRLVIWMTSGLYLVNADGSGMTRFPIEGARAVAFNPQPNGAAVDTSGNPPPTVVATSVVEQPTVVPITETPQSALPTATVIPPTLPPVPTAVAVASNTEPFSLDLTQHFISSDGQFSFDYPATLTPAGGTPIGVLAPVDPNSDYGIQFWFGLDSIYSNFPAQEGCMMDAAMIEASVQQALDTLIECNASNPSFNPQDIQTVTLNGKSIAYYVSSGMFLVNVGNGVPVLFQQSIGSVADPEKYTQMMLAMAGSATMRGATTSNVGQPTAIPAPASVVTSLTVTKPESEQQVIDTDTIWVLFGGQLAITKPGKIEKTSKTFVAKPLMLRYRWCAKTEDGLAEIVAPFSIKFYVDGVEIDPSYILVFDRLTQQKEYCRFYSTLLSDWPKGGEVHLQIIFTLTDAVNNGKTKFAAGTYETDVTMRVKG